MKYKHCAKCGQIMPVSEFNRRYDGFQPYCRECNRKYPKERLETADSHFELVVLPNGVRAFRLKKEYRGEPNV